MGDDRGSRSSRLWGVLDAATLSGSLCLTRLAEGTPSGSLPSWILGKPDSLNEGGRFCGHLARLFAPSIPDWWSMHCSSSMLFSSCSIHTVSTSTQPRMRLAWTNREVKREEEPRQNCPSTEVQPGRSIQPPGSNGAHWTRPGAARGQVENESLPCLAASHREPRRVLSTPMGDGPQCPCCLSGHAPLFCAAPGRRIHTLLVWVAWELGSVFRNSRPTTDWTPVPLPLLSQLSNGRQRVNDMDSILGKGRG
jgi:hypothetical protein